MSSIYYDLNGLKHQMYENIGSYNPWNSFLLRYSIFTLLRIFIMLKITSRLTAAGCATKRLLDYDNFCFLLSFMQENT